MVSLGSGISHAGDRRVSSPGSLTAPMPVYRYPHFLKNGTLYGRGYLGYPRAAVAVAARAAGVLAFDTPYVNFRDIEGLEHEIHSVVLLGFKGKFAIHPGQLDTINNLFSPSSQEIEYARAVIAAFEEAEARGSGATSLDGKMIDVPVVKRAHHLLALAATMSRRGA